MSTNTTGKAKRSVKLTEAEIQDVKNRVEGYPTKFAASVGMGVNADILHRVTKMGTCSEATYKKLFPAAEENDEAEIDEDNDAS